MAPRSSTATIPLPHYLVALVLVKSKPAYKSRQDWLQLLGTFIKDGPRSNDATAIKHYIDEAAMWHDAYTRSEENQLALQTRNIELERLLEELTEEPDSFTVTSAKKRRRKAIETSGAYGSRIQKKPRVVASAKAATSDETILGEDIEDDHRPATAPLDNPIISHLFILQQTLTQRQLEPTELATTLCHTATSIYRYVREVQLIQKADIATIHVSGIEAVMPRRLSAMQVHGKDDETTAGLFAVGQIFPKLLDGLDTLMLVSGGEVFEDRLVYDYIQIFQGLLQRVCDVATATAKERLAALQGNGLANTASESSPARSAKTKCSTCRDRKLKCDSRMPKCRNCSRLNQVCRNKAPASSTHTTVQDPVKALPVNQVIKLCELQIALLGYLDVGNQVHAKILQGFLCILFEKVGHGLKRCVFGSEDDGLPQGSDGNKATTYHDGREDDEAIEAQGPYLVWILEQAKSVLSRHSLSSDSNQPLSRIRNRLQNTLLKSVFGQEASIAFEPSLQPPQTLADADIVGLNIPPVEIKNWFKNEVWRMVGWDVLRNHIQWN